MGLSNWITKRRYPVRLAVARLMWGDEDGDCWRSIPVSFTARAMGYRCVEDIEQYFSGISSVATDGPEDIEAWLDQCTYELRTDDDGFSEEWLHPLEFERRRCGMCADFALWSWRKLVECRAEAKLFFGERFRDGAFWQHGWVQYNENGSQRIFEPCPVSGEPRIANRSDVIEAYRPWLSIDRSSGCELYFGYVQTIKWFWNRESA